MAGLSEALAEAGIRDALIVDDAFDPIPTANDIQLEADEWTFFFDDLDADEKERLKGWFPQYEEMAPDELAASNSFVAALWQHRTEIRAEVIDRLFARYEADMKSDAVILEKLRVQIEGLGLACTVVGRDFKDKALAADLIIIDLFLSSRQDAGSLDLSKTVLADVIRQRRANPPLVVLMSRSGRLEQKREEFRDEVRLLESGFRIIHKPDLETKLAGILTRFTLHRDDFRRLAKFLDAWQGGVQAAAERASAQMRSLDLSDFGQIQHLLLSAEGELPGNYIVDVFDRVLQHEVEREAGIISAAVELNGLTSASYPPPHLAGSPDLQVLMYRTLFQHPERLRLTGSEGSKIAFGDVLRMPAGLRKQVYPIAGITSDHVMVVLTPACDLQRQAARRVLLLVGVLKPLEAKDWRLGDDPVRTSVAEFGEQRYWIHWDLKFVDAISHDKLTKALAKDRLKIVARLREAHALELQQKVLSNLGRVGLPAMMPATFPVGVDICYLGPGRSPVSLEIPGLDAGGVSFMGRELIKREGKDDESKESSRLVLAEPVVDAIVAAVGALDLAGVAEESREAVQFLKDNDDLAVILTKSLKLPVPPNKQKIMSTSVTEGNGRVVGWVSRNGDRAAQLNAGDARKSGVLIYVTDLAP